MVRSPKLPLLIRPSALIKRDQASLGGDGKDRIEHHVSGRVAAVMLEVVQFITLGDAFQTDSTGATTSKFFSYERAILVLMAVTLWLDSEVRFHPLRRSW